MRQLVSGAGAIMLVVALGVGCNDDTNGPDLETDFEATLTGAAIRPTPVTTTTATGTASVTIDDDAQTISFTVNVTGLVDGQGAHIHVADVSTAGPVALTLTTTPKPGACTCLFASGTAQASEVTGGETFATLVAKIRAGNAYVQIHTLANPGGEIRGQLVPES